MKTIKGFIKILDHQTVIVTLLAVAATYLCNRYAKEDRYFNHLILYEIILMVG